MNSAFRNYFTYLPKRLYIEYFLLTSRDVRKRMVIRKIFGIHGRTADLS